MVFKKLNLILISALMTAVFAGSPLQADDFSAGNSGEKFIYAQLKFKGSWDPYPEAHKLISYYFTKTTSMEMPSERKILTLSDKELFYFPFLVFTGRGGYPEFTEDQIRNLRRYLRGGGIILLDTSGDDEFGKSAERTFRRAFPEKEFKKIPQYHAVFRSFYLVDYVSGRTLNRPYLTGLEIESKIAVIRTDNDIIGIWPQDKTGNPTYAYIPGKPGQQKEGIKLTLNIMIYSLSGTYKSDDVHQPFIKEKLRR